MWFLFLSGVVILEEDVSPLDVANVRFGSKADMCGARRHVRITPESGHLRCKSQCPLSANSGHPPIRSPRRRERAAVGGTVEAQCLRGLEVDHEFVLGRCLHRQVGWLLALEDAIDVAGGAPILVEASGP